MSKSRRGSLVCPESFDLGEGFGLGSGAQVVRSGGRDLVARVLGYALRLFFFSAGVLLFGLQSYPPVVRAALLLGTADKAKVGRRARSLAEIIVSGFILVSSDLCSSPSCVPSRPS